MSTIAIGDIHGNVPPLVDLLGQIRDQVGDGDTVVFLGDYIDRGLNTKECVETILAFQRDIKAAVICLCGNHEDWLLRTLADPRRHSWLLGMEAFDTIRSYSADAAQALRDAATEAGLALIVSPPALPYEMFFNVVPQAHLRFFRGLVPYYQSADCLCVHGGVNPRVSRIQDQTREAVIWGGDGFPEQYEGAEMVVYGHRNNADVGPSGWPKPKIIGRTIGLDTISHGVLTAMRFPDQHVFQSARYKAPGLDV